MNVFTQLREKRIVQIILSYLAFGWAVLEVADQLSDRGVVPNLVYTVGLVWFACGLVAAIVIGWNHGEKGKQSSSRLELSLLAVIFLFAFGTSGFVVRDDMRDSRMRAAAEHPVELRNVAVLYFDDRTDDPQLSFLADGLTEDLINALGSVRDLDVLSKNAAAQFRGAGVGIDSIAATLGVGTIVQGSVNKRAGNLEVSLELVDGRSGAVVQRSKITRPIEEVLTVRDNVVAEAANLLRQWIGKEVRLRASERGTEVREAWALVQRAERTRKEAEAAVLANGPAAGAAGFTSALDLLGQAHELDPQWLEPMIQRTAITYRRARLAAGSGIEEAVPLIEEGLTQANEVLALSRNEPRALELRGTLRYFKWLLNVTSDATERHRLFEDARADLESAVALDATLASAHSTLSHLLYNEDLASAVLAARRAYEEDAFLEVANEVVWRLFYGNFDLENFSQAHEWCERGQQRFKDDWRFTFCELRLMASPGSRAQPARAWALHARLDSLTPAPRKPFEHVRGMMAVGGVLARAGMRDSANAVLTRARSQVTSDIDPTHDLLFFEAHMRLLMGQNEAAFDLLRRGVLANPDQGIPADKPFPWMYRELQDHPRVSVLYTSK